MDPDTAPAGALPAVDTTAPTVVAKRWLLQVYTDERDRQIVRRIPLPPHEGPVTYHGTVVMLKVFPDGLRGQRQWNFQIPARTVNEAFDAYDGAVEKAKVEADRVMDQEHTRDALSGRLAGMGLRRMPAPPPRRVDQ